MQAVGTRRLGLGALAIAGGTLLSLAARDGLANSRVTGIPDECDMTTYSVPVGADLKGGKLEKLNSISVRGQLGVVRAFQMAHDGKRIAYHTFAGLAFGAGNEPPKDYKAIVVYKTVEWSPDSKKVRFLAPEGIAVADADSPGAEVGGKLNYSVVYKAPKGHTTPNAGFAPDGSIFVLEQSQEPPANAKDPTAKPTPVTIVQKVGAAGGAREILKSSDAPIGYFALPSCRFENGSGPSSAPYHVILGGKDALFRIGGDGGEREKILDMKPDGLEDILISSDPKTEKVLIRMGKDQLAADGKTTYKGVLMGHLDKWTKGKPLELETLYAKNDAHTIWFSQTGKYVSWASPDTVAFREMDGKPGSEVSIPIPEKGQIKGCYWSHDDSRIAVAAANKIYVYDVAKKALQPVADLGSDLKCFVADPVWRGDEIVFTQFVDTATKKTGK